MDAWTQHPSRDENAWDEEDWNLWPLLQSFATHNASRFTTLLLYAIARNEDCKSLVELGCYQGNTTAILARAAKKNGGHLWVYEVDPSHILRTELHLYQRGLRDVVTFVKGDTRKASPVLGVDLVFVDGDHSYEGVTADWEIWSPVLSVGGFMVFHDATTDPITTWIEETFPRYGWETLGLPGDAGTFIVRKVKE